MPVRCTNIIPEKYCRERERRGGRGRERRRGGEGETRFVRILSFRIRSLMPLQLLLRHSAASREWSSRGSWDGREYPPTKKSTSSDRIQSPTNSMYRWPDQPNNTYIYPLTYMLAQEKERFWIFGDVFEATVEFECESEKCQSVYRNRWIVDRKKKNEKI